MQENQDDFWRGAIFGALIFFFLLTCSLAREKKELIEAQRHSVDTMMQQQLKIDRLERQLMKAKGRWRIHYVNRHD